jgi:hypothetical protein
MAFENAISDSEDALRTGDTSVEFELASIATVIRHSAILGCYLLGRENFDRYDAVTYLCDQSGLPGAIKNEFPFLYRFRLAISRGQTLPARVSVGSAYDWCKRARMIVEEVKRHAPS